MNITAGGMIKRGVGLLALLSLAACDWLVTPSSSPVPPSRPAIITPPPPAPPPVTVPVTSSDDSRALSVFYQRMQNDLLARGLLRTDGGGPDTMFTDTVLARNFVRIALFNENVVTETGLRPQTTLTRLQRWEQPVRFSVHFGATIPEAQRSKDAASVAGFVDRLARVTGHPMSVTDQSPNFHVLILNEDDRLGFADQIRAIAPTIDDASLRALINVPRDTLCLVLGFARGDNSEYSKAIALIRGEHPDLMRLACIHEELAQGLGLANDSPRARPSIFNDDEEFGLLTTHDELLLKMLYDDRLSAGMTAQDAAPIARQLATELMEGTPS